MKQILPLALSFAAVDTGFIIYWIVVALNVVPEEYLFQDYSNPIMIAWNWSFFPLDIFISITGYTALYLYKIGHARWRYLAIISLTLMFCSGLQAIAFWALSCFFDVSWWSMNLALMIIPLFFVFKGLEKRA
jgi:hypothetical protein